MSVLSTHDSVAGYKVQSVIKTGEYTETYRVLNDEEDVFFMKLYILKRTPERLVNPETHQVYTFERCRDISHNNIISHITSGKVQLECGECQYIVTSYFTGDVLSDLIQRKGKLPVGDALDIYRGILEGLKYLHSRRLCHNDITPSNVMLNNAAGLVPEIIDMGHTANPCTGQSALPFVIDDLEILYCANETFAGLYDEQSDIFSATAVLYTMLTGSAPWEIVFSDKMTRARRCTLLKNKRKEEDLDISGIEAEDYVKGILQHGLAVDYSQRYKNVDVILDALNERKESVTECHKQPLHKSKGNGQQQGQEQSPNYVAFDIGRSKGKGFEDIAGMRELKALLKQKVIFVLQNKELAEKYRLTPPNGMLLYGPPGCGKTFFAEKFAEETGYNYIMVKSSDLASSYIHGSQEKIGLLFKQAEEKKPVVLCFDEFDALVPDRSNVQNDGRSSEVNEFLTQLNNCSKRGIFVIATSNRPDKIDPAILRTGRIDKQVFVPLPDKEARSEMFAIHLKDRPFNPEEINFNLLADRTEGYIASDIAYIVNDAAMTAAFTNQPITQEILETSLANTRPSLRKDTLGMYDKMRDQIESNERRNLDGRRPVGFNLQSTSD